MSSFWQTRQSSGRLWPSVEAGQASWSQFCSGLAMMSVRAPAQKSASLSLKLASSALPLKRPSFTVGLAPCQALLQLRHLPEFQLQRMGVVAPCPVVAPPRPLMWLSAGSCSHWHQICREDSIWRTPGRSCPWKCSSAFRHGSCMGQLRSIECNDQNVPQPRL